MTRLSFTARARRVGYATVTCSALLGALWGTAPARAQDIQDAGADAAQEETEVCIECHTRTDLEPLVLENGVELPVQVTKEEWRGSVHAERLACRDCHRSTRKHPHATGAISDERSYRVELGQACFRCHFATYKRTRDSIHGMKLDEGNVDAPTCMDCHGSHDVKETGSRGMEVADRCAKCHEEVGKTYAKSIHGLSAAEGKAGAPICTDCHGAHSIEDATEEKFHVASHQVCAKCHDDSAMMEEYDLRTDIVSSYLADYHGAANEMYRTNDETPEKPVASCTDCHGIHDIQTVEQDRADGTYSKRLEAACEQCHEGANSKFSGAWLAHKPASMSHAPMVWGIQWLYKLMIPGIIAALLIHIFMQIWRASVHTER